MDKVIVFIAGTILLGIISRRSLTRPRSHGFYRFFAWEVLLLMFVLNMGTWFRDPFTWYQLISWTLLIFSILLLILGLRLLRQAGEQDVGRKEVELLEWEKTSRLVTVGLYRYIRHPLYSSLLCLAWGMFFKSPSWLDLGLALICTIFLIATARAEEMEDIQFFGEEYVKYQERTKMFIPFVL